MYQFVPYAYEGTSSPSYTKVFLDQRLVAVVREPGKYAYERETHWRVDCDHGDYDGVVKTELKLAVQEHVGTEQVDVWAHPRWEWLGK